MTINVLANSPESKDLLTSTYFPSGSQLGVTVTNSSGGNYDGKTYNNICFTANGSDANQTWTGASDIMLSNTQGYCYAYYPYSSGVSDISSISVSTSKQTDYLYATSATVSATNRTASLTMKHALAAIRLGIKKGTYTGTGAVTGVSVSSSALGTSAVLNGKNGGLTGISGKGSTISVSKSLSLKTAVQNVDVIVVPTGSSADLTLSVTIDGKSYSTVVSAATVTQGKCNTYTLTVNAGELALSGIKIGDWTYNSAGSPTITAGGHTITFAGNYEDLLFSNKVVSSSEVTITACSRSGLTVYPVTASAGTLVQTYDGLFSVVTLSNITSDITVNFNGAGTGRTVTKRFYPAGTYTWTVPEGVYSVDVFLVGAGGGSNWTGSGATGGGGGGYTKTFRGGGYVAPSSGTWVGSTTEGRDGNAVNVTPGESIQIIVGGGVAGGNGGYSQFKNSNYRADGGYASTSWATGAAGGSGGSSCRLSSSQDNPHGGSDGSDAVGGKYQAKGQGHTTRDFGESTGLRNAGGGASLYGTHEFSGTNRSYPGESDYTSGTGNYQDGSNGTWTPGKGGGGYGGGAGTPMNDGGDDSLVIPQKGGDGTVLIRYQVLE